KLHHAPDETLLEQRWGFGEQSLRLWGEPEPDAAAILAVGRAGEQLVSDEPLDDPGHRRLAELQPAGEFARRERTGGLDLAQCGELGPGQAVVRQQLPRMQIDRPDDPTQGDEDLLFGAHI